MDYCNIEFCLSNTGKKLVKLFTTAAVKSLQRFLTLGKVIHTFSLKLSSFKNFFFHFLQLKSTKQFVLGFPMGRDFIVLGQTGQTSLHCPGTKGQAQNLAMGRAGPGQPIKIWDGTRDRTITIFLPKSGTGRRQDGTITIFCPMISCFRASFSVLEHLFLF